MRVYFIRNTAVLVSLLLIAGLMCWIRSLPPRPRRPAERVHVEKLDYNGHQYLRIDGQIVHDPDCTQYSHLLH